MTIVGKSRCRRSLWLAALWGGPVGVTNVEKICGTVKLVAREAVFVVLPVDEDFVDDWTAYPVGGF
jgi:hypothetical protein